MAACVGPLDEFVDKNQLECLNSVDGTVVHAFSDGPESLLSDPDDGQIIIKVTFKGPMNISQVKVQATSDDGSAPTEVLIFRDRPDIGFDEAEDEAPTDTLMLEADTVDKNEATQMRFVKFQNCSNLQIFVKSNMGEGAQTKIQRMSFLGSPAASMDMKDWKPIKG